MRVGIFVVSAILAGAGVAFAQSDWVVDPWAPASIQPSAVARTPSAAAPLALPSRLHVPVEWIDERNFELTDPWLSSPPSPLGASPPAPIAGVQVHPAPARRSGESGEWAKPVPLLVDPWAPEPPKAWAPASDLIVDPWATDVSGP